jgi:hypothetical protein
MNTGDPEPAVSLLQEIYARSLLGQQVRVILDRTGDTPDVLCEWDVPGTVPHEDVITEGKLLGFGQGGDFEILEDDGFVHYCWPMLKIERR